jgi:diguanylate cyclase (GGDEF)-like protein
VFRGLAAASAGLSFRLDPARAAAAVLLAASLLSLLRWTFTARPMELGLTLVIFIAAAACAQTQRQHQLLAFTGAGAFAALAVLYASYRMAFIDGLTGLPNRRALDEALMRVGGGYALAMVDIDHFKQFNDTYGHGAGDVVLRTVARTLRRHVGGQTFRYGGEEFCVIFEGRRAGLAAEGCERAREAVQQHRIDIPTAMLKGKRDAARGKALQVSVTISVGCAERAADRKTAADVLKAADQALYKAKAKGRNRVIKA